MIGWLLPWFLIAVVVGVGVWMVFDYRDRSEGAGDPVAQAGESTPDGTATESPTEEPVDPSPEPTGSEPEQKPEPKEKPVRLIIEGVTIQVLNGTSDPEAGTEMAEALAGLGFQIVTIESTSKLYKDTTVFWSFPDAIDAGRALAAKRRWASGMKPGNLSDSVSLHVVVGSDFLD